jgi:hypothetical protein
LVQVVDKRIHFGTSMPLRVGAFIPLLTIDRLTFPNHRRLHSTLGHVSPMKFEQRWIAAHQQDMHSAQVAAY